MYNILIGGAAGDGIETTSAVLGKILKNNGYSVHTMRDFMSRVRGGHNFIQMRFGTQKRNAHENIFDVVVVLNEESYEIHKDKLKENGVILCDTSLDITGENVIKIDMKGTAKKAGNVKAFGAVAIGALLKLFSESIEFVEHSLETSMKADLIPVNMEAIKAGYSLVENKFTHSQGDFGNDIIINGNQAIALGALAADLKFFAAYPMSPSTTIMEYLHKTSAETGIVVEQVEDEIAAANMIIGASYAGARSMTATSGGGFSLMVEALGFSGIAEIPIVIANIARPGPATGLPTRTEQSDLKFMIYASQGEFPRMVISIRNHTDAFYQTARAFELAEKYQIPVIILSDQYLSDSSATVKPFSTNKTFKTKIECKVVPDENGNYKRYAYTDSNLSPRLYPNQTDYLVSADSDEHDEYGQITEAADVRIKMVDKRQAKLKMLEQELIEPEFFGNTSCETLLVGFGSTYEPMVEAIEILNKKYNNKFGALVFGDVFPLPTKSIKKYAGIAKKIINVEQNATGQLASHIRETTLIDFTSSILKYDGRQINAAQIVIELEKMME